MDGADKAEDFLQIDHFTALRVSLRLETPIIWSFYAAENCQKSTVAGSWAVSGCSVIDGPHSMCCIFI